MSALTAQDVERIATLARIEIDESTRSALLNDLGRVLDLIDRMQAVQTQGVAPLTHPGERVLRLRADQVTETDQREAMQGFAPRVEDGLYLVPRVIE
jgi:aspartyl-tRNA(Asn)/glutamyl-tRNA(Gln) amidotransferase subunit C